MGLMLAVLAFLAGSFPSGLVLARLLTGRDVRAAGSGNIGAANTARVAGFRVGMGVALLDILKGVLPVVLGKLAGLDATGLAIVALAAVLGHDFSVFLRFRGGKGVATTLGVAVVLAPAGAIMAAAVWLGVLLLTSYASLASLLALAVLPLTIALTGGSPIDALLAFVLFLLAAGKHWPNIVRLLSGTEEGFRRRRADGA